MRGRGTRRRVRARTRDLERALSSEDKAAAWQTAVDLLPRGDRTRHASWVRPLLAIARHSPSAQARELAVYALSFLIDDRAWWTLLDIACDRQSPAVVRGQALEGLAYLFSMPLGLRRRRNRKTVSALMALLGDAEAPVRFWAIFALGQGRVRAALPRLETIAASDDDGVVPDLWSVREEASDAATYLKTGEWPDREQRFSTQPRS